jgi:intein-encoded DNA endonuclease-like protein
MERFQTEEVAAAYLAGMIDGEGTVYINSKVGKDCHRIVVITNTDVSLLEACQSACVLLDISCRVQLRTKSINTRHKDVYELAITDSKSFRILAEKVPVQAVHKREALEKIIHSYDPTRSEYKRRGQV